jgi:hypothetical protein
MNILGDGDLIINSCLIDFKTKKESKVSNEDLMQLTAYDFLKESAHLKFDKIFTYNPRYGLITEITKLKK